MEKRHTFHIPVMGIGFTIDSPLKVAHLGIDSVISLVDDILIEKLRKMYSEKFEIPYQEITEKMEDFRARRITSYLNMIQDLATEKFEALKSGTQDANEQLKKYIDLLPDTATIKEEFNNLIQRGVDAAELKIWASKALSMGSIDVNIMTKVDKDNYRDKEQLPNEYNDAHAALRGFAESNLESSVVLSAGLNPKLYSYMGQFDDFFPDENGYIKKKIILKVSDYRSALIQGKFLAKRGLWVSEYRIESGLNCGGHAFATDGYLMGPVLEEFKENRAQLQTSIFDELTGVLANMGKTVPNELLPLKITAQGGVGTKEEHEFLIDYYGLDAVGWGSPFLLVPEATTVDDPTIKKLEKAEEEDLYLSDISPLGIKFNSLKGNTKDIEKQINIDKNRPGSSCPKKLISLNKEFKESGLCVASREYQYNKLKALDEQDLPKEEYQRQYDKIVEKSCTCVGLGTSALIKYGLSTKTEGDGVSICPGPNMAYYDKRMSLKDMVGHIYGKTNVLAAKERPHMFVKELGIYMDYLSEKVEEIQGELDRKQKKYFNTFIKNMEAGINYYRSIVTNIGDSLENQILTALDKGQAELFKLKNQVLHFS